VYRALRETSIGSVGLLARSVLTDIGFPDEIPGLTVNQEIVDQYLEWSSFDKTWPHGGNEADDEGDGLGDSDKENEWVVTASSE